jgi:ABC-type multidrug transport system ATPase subunit
VYRELTPLENLSLFARLYRIRERGERVGMLLERFALWEVRHERVSTFSRGMQQRLGLARVLLHDPKLLVLDEPYNALDVEGAALLDAALAEPKTYVVATHASEHLEPRATQSLVLS